jgi:hypothetical protein
VTPPGEALELGAYAEELKLVQDNYGLFMKGLSEDLMAENVPLIPSGYHNPVLHAPEWPNSLPQSIPGRAGSGLSSMVEFSRRWMRQHRESVLK